MRGSALAAATLTLSTEDAVRVLRSGVAIPEERIGAALILARRAGSEPGERARIRLAASACIDPRVRVALERVADDDLDEATLASATSGAHAPR